MFFRLNRKQKHWVEFLMAMTEKEIKARYKMAVLGFLWVFLNPTLQMLVMGIIFQYFVPVKVDNYFLFLFSGLLAWNFFSYTVSKNTPMIVFERALIQKAKFPREVIVLSIVLSNLFNMVVSLLVFLLIVVLMGKFGGVGWLILPLPLIFLTLLTTGLSLLFAALNVRFRDISFVVQAVMPLWFYATPVVYTLALLPEEMRSWFYLNPMTSIVEWSRFLILGVAVESWRFLGWGLVTCCLIFVIGWVVFAKISPTFDDWI